METETIRRGPQKRRRTGVTTSKTYAEEYKQKPHSGVEIRKLARAEANKVLHRVQEVKRFNVLADTTASTTPVLARITGIAQGDQDNQRDGDTLYLKSLCVRFNFVVADTTNFIRVIVFQWHQHDNAYPPDANAIFQNPSFPTLTTLTYDLRASRTVLYDRVFTVDASNRQAIATNDIWIKNIPKRKLQFTAATTNGENHLYIAYASDSGAANHPGIRYYTMVRFTDS